MTGYFCNSFSDSKLYYYKADFSQDERWDPHLNQEQNHSYIPSTTNVVYIVIRVIQIRCFLRLQLLQCLKIRRRDKMISWKIWAELLWGRNAFPVTKNDITMVPQLNPPLLKKLAEVRQFNQIVTVPKWLQNWR